MRGRSTTATNTWVSIGHHSAYDLTNGITLSVWLKPAQPGLAPPGYSAFFQRGDGYFGNWALSYTDARRILFQMTGQNGNSLSSFNALPTNAWTHVAATFDGATARLYLNGLLERAVPWNGAHVLANSVARIGLLAGTLDDARVYSIALYFAGDTDHDRLPDPDETAAGASATNRDTDGDGFYDGLEVRAGTVIRPARRAFPAPPTIWWAGGNSTTQAGQRPLIRAGKAIPARSTMARRG